MEHLFVFDGNALEQDDAANYHDRKHEHGKNSSNCHPAPAHGPSGSANIGGAALDAG